MSADSMEANIDLMLTAFSDAGPNLCQDLQLNAMAISVASFVAGLNGFPPENSEALRLAVSVFMMGYMAREENWIEREW